jgi:serine/threonine protein kinase
MAELDLMKLLRDESHTGIVRVIDVFEDTQKILVVMECVEGGSLYQWIKDNLSAPESLLRFIFRQIC